MAKKRTETAPGTETASLRAPRVSRPLSQVEAAIVKEANEKIAEAKQRIRETKHLGKVLVLVNTLSIWGCSQVITAVQARQHALQTSEAKPAE